MISASIETDKNIQARSGLRVLFVIPGNGTGASMIFARRQVESLAEQGVTVRTFYFGERLSLGGLVREWRRLRQDIREFRPHLLHAQYGTATAFLAAMSSSLPLVITFRGSDLNICPEIGFVRGRVSWVLSQFAALRASRIICVTRQLRDRLWWRRNSVLVLPTGVNLQLFRPLSRRETRVQLKWPEDIPVVLLNVGSTPIAKGLDLVKAAVAVAERRIGPIRLEILEGGVEPAQMPVYMSAADCLALASVREGSPTVVQEAMACNLPVVSVDIGDVSDRLAGVAPSAVVARDSHEFGNALADILIRRQRSNGRERVAECSEEVIVARIRSLYEDLTRTSTGINQQNRAQPAARSAPRWL